MNDTLEGQEILFAFCGWLTAREEKTVMSSSDDAGCIVQLIEEFSKRNKLSECRDGWQKKIIQPPKYLMKRGGMSYERVQVKK